ncbi:acyltransferase family protein [Pseudoalteromonas xiamenensis]
MEIRKLNALRALAALIVFVTHFSDVSGWFSGRLGGGAGAYGVMLFFMLSGFLMAHLYCTQTWSASNVRRYVIARIARIVPLYLVIVTVSFVLSLMDNNGLYAIPNAAALMGHLLFLYGDSVLWSIAPEVQFYVVFIGLWAFAMNKPGFIYLIVVVVLIALFFSNFPKVYGEFLGIPYNEFNVLRSFPYFFVGVLFGMNHRKIDIPDYLKSHWFILSLALIVLMYPSFSPITSDAKNRMWLSYEVLLVMGSIFFAILYLVPDTNVLLSNDLTDFLGKISYSLYLLHLPIIRIVEHWEFSVELKLLASLSLSIVSAYLSFRYFEYPIAQWIKRQVSTSRSVA